MVKVIMNKQNGCKFLIEDDNLSETYNAICDKVSTGTKN